MLLLEFDSFGYFCIPTVNKDLNKRIKFDSGKYPFGEISFGKLSFKEMSVRGIVRLGNCPSKKCLWGTVRRGKVRPGSVRRGTFLEPLTGINKFEYKTKQLFKKHDKLFENFNDSPLIFNIVVLTKFNRKKPHQKLKE